MARLWYLRACGEFWQKLRHCAGVELIVSTPAMRNNRSGAASGGRYDVCAGTRTRDEALHRRAGWPACHEKQQTCISW